MKKSQSSHTDQIQYMREALDLSLSIIVQLSKQMGVQNFDQLDKLEDIDGLPSLVDLLKFIQTD